MSDQNVLKKLLEELRSLLDSKNHAKCSEKLDIIREYLDSPLSSSEYTYALELLLKFNDSKINVLRFLAKSLPFSSSSTFSECNKRIFELIQAATTGHASKVKPYSKDIVGICVVYLDSGHSTAGDKEYAVDTISSLLSHEAFSNDIDVSKLVDDLMMVFKQKSPPIKTQRSVYELLGTLSKQHPGVFAERTAVELRNKMLNTIQSFFKDVKANISLTLIAGAVEGLKNHLVNFTPDAEDDPNFSFRLYECMINLTDPSETSSNRVAYRKMLEIVNEFGHVLNIPEFLFRDFKRWQEILLKWMSSTSYDDKIVGVYAIQTFHQQVAEILVKRRNEDDKRILLFFMKYFRSTLEAPTSEPHEIRVAIRGFGSMAGACKLLLEPSYLCDLFDLVMQRTEYSYHTKDRLRRRDVLEHLPNYVESLSQIMKHLDEISGIQLQSLQSIIVILIKDFHFLSTAHHSLVSVALLDTFVNLQKLGGKVLESVLEFVTWQGILWTCSHQLVYDLQENIDNIKDWKETITYRKYLPLWKRLLTSNDPKHTEVCKEIYNLFIHNLFVIIDQLDLSTRKRTFVKSDSNVETEFFFSDPSLDLEPIRPENFQILYNLVQFYGDVIAGQSDEVLQGNFVEWIDLWLEKSIQLSLKHSLVSGFLQLIEIALKVINRLGIVDESSQFLEPLKFFVSSMLFVRCQQTSGELQISCLQLVFQIPTKLLHDFVVQATPIFVLGFSLGRGLISLANLAMTAFEKLVDSLDNDAKTRRKVLEDVLPSLETFLSSRDAVEFKVKQVKKKKISNETDLMQFKKRILLFLGQFDPEESQLILSKFDQKLVRDHVTNVLKIKLECNGEKFPMVFIDDTVARVCELAMTSSERATRISACELLHGLVLYMMGKNLDGSETLPLWRDLCDKLIILGADKDMTVRNLFETLLMQMMHYFAMPEKILSAMTTSAVESIMGMICFPGNSGVQDLSARLLREFMLWVNKQNRRNNVTASPVQLVDLFHEMRKMSIETNESRRMGATLAFNNIYRIIREDPELIDTYWIYLLDVFATNFKNTEDFSTNLEANFIDGRRFEQISSSLDHIRRVFVERCDIFEKESSNRIIPEGFGGKHLEHVMIWLFKECSRKQFHYRHKCMEVFDAILATGECGSKEEFYEKNFSVANILAIGEMKNSDLKFLAESGEPMIKGISDWLQSLLTTLDFYIWVLENQLMPEGDVNDFLQQTSLLQTVNYFLMCIHNKDITEVTKSIDSSFGSSVMSHENRMNFRNLSVFQTIRCVILARIIDLVTILIKKNRAESFLTANQTVLLKILKQLVFKPHKIGFSYKSKSLPLELPKRLVNFVTAIHEKAPTEFRRDALKLIRDKLIKHFSAMKNFEKFVREKSTKAEDIDKVAGIELVVLNFRKEIELDDLQEALLMMTAKVLLDKIFLNIVENSRPRHLTPSIKFFTSRLFKLCIRIDSFLEEIVKFSFNSEELKVTDTCTIRHGDHFMQTFKNVVFVQFTDDIARTVRGFKEFLDANPLRIIGILTEINKFVFQRYKSDEKLLVENLEVMVAHWPVLLNSVSTLENKLNCVDLAIIDFVTHLAMTCPIKLHDLGRKLEGFEHWLLSLLGKKENSLEIKSKAVPLLPCITSIDEPVKDELTNVLNSIQQRHMPLKSHEFPEGSLKRAELVAITEKLFQAFLTSRSPVIYRFIIVATIADGDYLLESKLQQVQREFMEKSIDRNEQEVIMSQIFDEFMTGGHQPEVRLSFVSRYLLTIMKSSHVDVMLDFVRSKMPQIWNLTESPLHVDMNNALVNRCAGFMIIEAFYASVSLDMIDKEVYSYAGKTGVDGKTVRMEIIKKARKVDVGFIVDGAEAQELFRKFQCCCYQALATIISNTQTSPAIYNTALFQEKSITIWRRLIDIKNENLYANLTQEFEEFPRIKEHIISVKDLQTTSKASKNYIETVSIFDQSLSQSLTKTDLSYSVGLTKREILESEQKRRELGHQNTMRISLESTPINDHEIMSVYVGVINHIHANKLSPTSNFEKHEESRYMWVVSLASSLRQNHKNVKIFLAKLVDNCRNVLMPYAQFLLGPILSVITYELHTMSFFLTDLVAMLLSWSKVYKPTTDEEKRDACALLKFLVENASNERREIFKLNLELIKKLVETWSEILAVNIPTQTLLSLLQQQDMNQNLISGIQLNAVILANDLSPWRGADERELFLKAILKCFTNSEPKIYQSSSQLLGMCLAKISQEISEDELKPIVEGVTEYLEKVRKRSNDINHFLQLLYGIQKGFPRILDTFMTLIKFNIPHAVRKIKCIYLEMYLSRLEVDGDDVYRELLAIGTRNLLKQNEYQLLALFIINKAIENLSGEQINGFLGDLELLMNSPREEVRRFLVEMMINIAEKFRGDTSINRKLVMRVILKGFTDSDQEIQNRVANFFSSEGELSKTLPERFQELLLNYYDPALEREFLHYATLLLLDISVKHPRSKLNLLDYDETKNKDFVEFKVPTRSMSQRSLPPMFIPSSSSQQLFAGDGSLGNIIATQDDRNVFTPTLDPVQLSQVSQSFEFKQTQNSLFFDLKPQFLDRQSRSFTQTVVENNVEEMIAENKDRPKLDALDYLRQRIVKRTHDAESRSFAHRAIEKRSFQAVKTQERLQKARAGREVRLYRRYRHGELPDFFFNTLSILLPLQALTKSDVIIARIIFINLFQSIVEILKDFEDEEKEFFTSINESIMKILQDTKNTDSFLISALIEMAMRSKKFLEISPDVLANVVTANNLMVTGTLFLESQLNHLNAGVDERGDGEPSQKQVKIDENERKMKHWMKLIDLNYKMKEYEVIHGIFTEKLNLDLEVRASLIDAIDFELNSKFKDASRVYEQLISRNAARNEKEKEIYYQSFFNCLENLSDWSLNAREIQGQFDSYDDVWCEETPFHKDTLLPHLLKSELRMILDGSPEDEFTNVLEEWINDEEKGEYLRENFPEEIVVLHILEMSHAEGSVEAERALRAFGEQWGVLEMFDEKLQCLQKARTMAELSNFLDVISSTGEDHENHLKKLFTFWKHAKPCPSDSLVHYSDLMAYRKNFVLQLADERQPEGANYLLNMSQNLLEVAFIQKNSIAAKAIIGQLKQDVVQSPSDENKAKCFLAAGKYYLMIEEEAEHPLKRLCTGFDRINTKILKKKECKKYPGLMIESLCVASELSWKMYNYFKKNPEDENQAIVTELIEAVEDESHVCEHLLRYSLYSLQQARSWAQRFVESDLSPQSEAVLADTHLKLGKFYHQVFNSGDVTTEEVQAKIIKSIFNAINCGSAEAKIFIPYLLQLPDLKNSKITQQFNECLDLVPIWMFIPYISQMLSNYDFEVENYLDVLLERLAVKYPNALYFPFKLSLDHYQQSSNRGMQKENVARIITLISNPSMDLFTRAIQCLVMPEKLISMHFVKFLTTVRDENITKEEFLEAAKKFHFEVFKRNGDIKGDFQHAELRDWKKSLELLMKMDFDHQHSEIQAKCKELQAKLKLLERKNLGSIRVDKLCTWMANYKWSGDKDFFEIPGQYSGNFKPFIENHVKVVRFEDTLKVYKSKQQPLELKILGSDGKFYNFIIKHGEDLRQDQRIQQVFGLMSRQLSMDKNCKQNKLQIQTYQVVPINCNCGMLSVVQNVTTISDLLDLFGDGPLGEEVFDIRKEFRMFLAANQMTGNFQEIYNIALRTYSRRQLAEKLEEMENRIPRDILKDALMKSALSLEAYYIIRQNFVTSLATMSVANWILGIGDRHLNNILIDTKTGRLVGIDFGVAFGIGANLSIPEIVPFRLTSHFVSILEPMGVNGMIKKNMMHAMRCLREFKKPILICLESFVNEPTMDWQQQAKKTGNEMATEWNPEARIKFVERKLNGDNPLKIIKDELSISETAKNPDTLRRYFNLFDGDDSRRKTWPDVDLSVENQVSCLIEMATDKALLAMSYLGWDPWL